MDASRIFKFAILLGALVSLSGAVPVTTEAEFASSATTEEMEETTVTTSTPAPPRNCTTARALAGVCAARQDCDHSTGPVDHSLYAPSWYKSSCMDGEVCCPFFALVTEQPQTDEHDENESAFNDDN